MKEPIRTKFTRRSYLLNNNNNKIKYSFLFSPAFITLLVILAGNISVLLSIQYYYIHRKSKHNHVRYYNFHFRDEDTEVYIEAK